MAFITLDFETYYEERKPKGVDRPRQSLRNLTLEEYLRSPMFKVHSVGVKVDAAPAEYFRDVEVADVLQRTFSEGNDHTLLCHNVMFDGAILSWHYGLQAARYLCTQAMSRAVWNHESASLRALGARLFPDDTSKRKTNELVQFAGVWELTREQHAVMARYCLNDVELTFDCFKAMWDFFPQREMQLIDITSRMAIEPVLELNATRIKNYLNELVSTRLQTMQASGLPEKVLASNPQFSKWIQDNGMEVPDKPSPSKEGERTEALSKNDAGFIRLQREHPEHAKIWKARMAAKSIGEQSRCKRLLTHRDPETGRIALPLAYGAAHTHRFGGTNKVNPQNFKRGSEIRKSIRAPKGYVIGVSDYSQIEARKNAWFSEDELLMHEFAEGIDIYSNFATELFGRPIDRKHTEIVDGETVYPDFAEGFVGKTAILGLGYQMGRERFQNQVFTQGGIILDDATAQRSVDLFRSRYNAIKANWNRMTGVIFNMVTMDPDASYDLGPLTICKRQIILPSGLALSYPRLHAVNPEDERTEYRYWTGKYWTKLYGGKLTENIIQALARIVLTEAMINVNAWLKEHFPGSLSRVVLQVHDEILYLLPRNEAKSAIKAIEAVMTKKPAWCDDPRLVLAVESGYDTVYSK